VLVETLNPAQSINQSINQTYWGHDLGLSGSRDVMGHVTIGLGMGHFLLTKCTSMSICHENHETPLLFILSSWPVELIIMKIIRIVATRYQIFGGKMYKI